MPQIYRHNHAVDKDNAGPDADIIEHPPPAWFQCQGKPGLPDAKRQQSQCRRHRVAQIRPRHPDHRDRIRSEPDQQTKSGKPDRSPQRSARSIGKISFAPRIAQLVDGQPHESKIGEVDIRHFEQQGRGVDGHCPHHQHPECRHAKPFPRGMGDGNQRRHQQIYRQKPHRYQRQLGGELHHLAVNTRRGAEQRKQRPDDEQRQHRIDQPLHSRRKPARIGAAAAPVRGPRQSIGKSADQKEYRHDLKPPGQPLRPRQYPQQMPALHRAILHIGCRDQPVAGHHRKDRKGAQKIDIAVALGRGFQRHVLRA